MVVLFKMICPQWLLQEKGKHVDVESGDFKEENSRKKKERNTYTAMLLRHSKAVTEKCLRQRRKLRSYYKLVASKEIN